MLTFEPQIETALRERVREVRLVVVVDWDEFNSTVFTSHADITWAGGTVFSSSLGERVSSISQGIDPENFRTSIGNFSFQVVDRDAGITQHLGARIASGFGFGQAEARLFLGFAGFAQADFQQVLVQDVRKIDYDWRQTYTFGCLDAWGKTKKNIFRPFTARLGSTAHSVASTTIVASEPILNFKTIAHGLSYSDQPGVPAIGYLKIGDEYISYTEIVGDQFRGCRRGLFGSTAEAYTPDPTKEAPEIEEVIYLEGPVVDLISIVLSGQELNDSMSTTGVYPAHWNIGLSRDDDLDALNMQDVTAGDLWTGIATEGIQGRILAVANQDGKTFIERELLPLIGCYLFVKPDGNLTLRRLPALLGASPPVIDLTRSNVSSVGRVAYDTDGVRNQFDVLWNYNPVADRTTRRAAYEDLDSISKHGASQVVATTLRVLTGSSSSSQVLRYLLRWRSERLVEPPLRGDVRSLSAAFGVQAGDTVRMRAVIRDFVEGEEEIDRTFEVRRVETDYRALRVGLQLFGSTAKRSADVGATIGAPVMNPVFYTGEGDPLPGVIVGVLQGSPTIGGGPTREVYYHDGDLEIPVGNILTVDGDVELRVRGTLTINGEIQGLPTVPPVSDIEPTADTWLTVVPRNPNAGTPGWIGNTRAGSGEASNADNVPPIEILGQTPEVAKLDEPPTGRYPCPTAEGVHQAFPELAITNVDGDSLRGLPASLKGTSGGKGGHYVLRDPETGYYAVYPHTGSGGRGGAGLVIVCQGLALGLNGKIRLPGEDGDPGTAYNLTGGGGAPTSIFVHSGPGAGGSGGSLLVLLDGGLAPDPTIELLTGGFESVGGRNPWAGDVNQSPDLGLSQIDQSAAAFRVQYIPAAGGPLEDLTPVSSLRGRAEVTPSVGLIFEDINGDADLAAFNATLPDMRVYRDDGTDITALATFRVTGYGGTGGAVVTIDPTTGLWTCDYISGSASVFFAATVSGRDFFAAAVLYRMTFAARGSIDDPPPQSGPPTSYVQVSQGNTVGVPPASLGFLDGATETVVGLWLRLPAIPHNEIVYERFDGGGTQFRLRSYLAQGLQILASSSARGTTFSNTDLVDDTWRFIAIHHRAGLQVDMYLDGAQISGTPVGAAPLALPTVSSDFTIGGGGFEAAQIAIWAGRAFSTADFADMFNAAEDGTLNSGFGGSSVPDYYNDLAAPAGLTVVGSPTFVTP